MPTYQYVCEKCGHQFEQIQPISAKPLTICPKELCARKRWGKGKVKRAIIAGAGLIFKGSGFYSTDYRSEKYKEAAKKDVCARQRAERSRQSRFRRGKQALQQRRRRRSRPRHAATKTSVSRKPWPRTGVRVSATPAKRLGRSQAPGRQGLTVSNELESSNEGAPATGAAGRRGHLAGRTARCRRYSAPILRLRVLAQLLRPVRSLRRALGFAPTELSSLATNQDFVELEPTLATVSCERIKQMLVRELNVTAPWRGTIYLVLYPARSAGDAITITSDRFKNGWQYRVDLPDVVERPRYVRAMVQVLLLELANRTAPARGAEIPLWLVEGFSQLAAGLQ